MNLDTRNVGRRGIARELGEEERGEPVELMVLLAGSPTDLRRSVPAVAGIPCAARFRVVLGGGSDQLPPPVPVAPGSDAWQGLLDLSVHRTSTGGWSVELAFLDPVEPSGVLAALSQAVVGGRRQPVAGPVGRLVGVGPGSWGPGDALANTTRKADTDLCIGACGGEAEAADTDGAVLHRVDHADVRWAGYGRPNVSRAGVPFSEHDVPPVDERVVNPIGFKNTSRGGRGQLLMRDGRLALVAGGSELLRVADDGTVTDAQIARIRHLRQVDVDWGAHSGPLAAVRAVASLAAAGIPLTGGAPPAWSQSLGTRIHTLLSEGRSADLSEGLPRIEHSIRLRRAALLTHGAHARWAALGAEAGVHAEMEDEVSVLLVTRRPEMLGFALRQVARQRSVRMELVVVLHGFDRDHPAARRELEWFRSCGHALTVVEAPTLLPLGSLLNRAVHRAHGTVLAKMDDDDWYGPDHLADLLLARRYSGADVVGNAAEFVYLQELDLTIRRIQQDHERVSAHVGGGTLLFDRRIWEEVGGFRPLSCGEDSALLGAVVRAGGRVYRTHGCNYVLRRKGRGHTWGVGAGHFLSGPEKFQHIGWQPSALLESDPRDRPAPGRIARALAPGSAPASNRDQQQFVGGGST
ncbi:glycosyltransferase [Nocardiopsis salina]|uniref:glycosyltransferase n=1 Tax=Nocardiopsis salina TaxID=245836 RepID=UPI001267CA5A|nr:glycosyltransferase family A protein [Nocardiopsis salina]